MEAGNSPAGNCNKHKGPYRKPLRMQIPEGELGNRILGKENDRSADTDSHDDQDHPKYRIEPANDFVDGKQGRQKKIDQNDDDPEFPGKDIRRKLLQKRRGAGDKHSSHQDQQHDGKNPHDIHHGLSHIDSGKLRDRLPGMSLGDHPDHIIMYSSTQNRSRNDPQENHRSKTGSH